MKKYYSKSAFNLLSIVSAEQDINITLDTLGSELCLTSDFISHTCNSTQILTLDGTDDHMLIFTPKKSMGAGINNSQMLTNIIYDPVIYIFSGSVLAVFFIMLLILPLIVKWINTH